MKVFIILHIFAFLVVLQQKQTISIVGFAEKQISSFDIIKNEKYDYFVKSIEESRLYKQKYKTAIKSKKSHSNENSYNKKVYTRIQIWQYDFESEEKCKHAISILLNCFPSDCSVLKTKEKRKLKITPSIWILAEKSIYIARTVCGQVDEKWNKFQKDFIDTFANNKNDIIVSKCGELEWTSKEKINFVHELK